VARAFVMKKGKGPAQAELGRATRAGSAARVLVRKVLMVVRSSPAAPLGTGRRRPFSVAFQARHNDRDPARGRNGLRRLIVISVEVRRVGFCGCHSIFSQVAPGELHEDVFEAGLARAEVFELMAVVGYRIQKSGDS